MKKSQDLTPIVLRARGKRTVSIVVKALDLLFPGQELKKEDFSFEYETVDNWHMPVYTVRYKGQILCRRFNTDALGLKYEYESPIFK